MCDTLRSARLRSDITGNPGAPYRFRKWPWRAFVQGGPNIATGKEGIQWCDIALRLTVAIPEPGDGFREPVLRGMVLQDHQTLDTGIGVSKQPGNFCLQIMWRLERGQQDLGIGERDCLAPA